MLSRNEAWVTPATSCITPTSAHAHSSAPWPGSCTQTAPNGAVHMHAQACSSSSKRADHPTTPHRPGQDPSAKAHLAIHSYEAACGVIESEQQAQDSGLPSPCSTYQAQSPTAWDLEADVLQHCIARGVLEADMVKLQSVRGWGQGLGIFLVLCS